MDIAGILSNVKDNVWKGLDILYEFITVRDTVTFSICFDCANKEKSVNKDAKSFMLTVEEPVKKVNENHNFTVKMFFLDKDSKVLRNKDDTARGYIFYTKTIDAYINRLLDGKQSVVIDMEG